MKPPIETSMLEVHRLTKRYSALTAIQDLSFEVHQGEVLGLRIDSAASPGDWLADAEGNQKKIAATFRQACDVAKDHGERLAAEGEICWAGMHSWKRMLQRMRSG